VINCALRRRGSHFFPGPEIRALSKLAMEIGSEARRDTLRAIREAMEFASRAVSKSASEVVASPSSRPSP
jgi:hypothetical protein